MLIFIVSFILTAAVALLQTTNWILFDAIIKPNLILITLIVLAPINPIWTRRALFIFTAALIVKFMPGFALFDLIFIAAAALSIILMDILPWRGPVNLSAAVVTGTVAINLPRLAFLPITYELILNLLFAFILFTLLKLVYVSQIELQRNRF